MAIRWEKLTVKSQQAMEQAQARAAELGNPEVQPVHLLLALIEDREGVIPVGARKRSAFPPSGWSTSCTRSRRNCLAWPERPRSRA